MDTYIYLQNISKTYQKSLSQEVNLSSDNKTTVIDIDKVKIPLNSFVVIVGYSGAGKSTLMNILSLLDVPDETHYQTGKKPLIIYQLANERLEISFKSYRNKIYSDEQKLSFNITHIDSNGNKKNISSTELREKYLSYVFQQAYLHPNFSLKDNVKTPLMISNTMNEQSVDKFIEDAGLSAHKDKYITKISGGEQQRTAILRALIKQAPILIGDELTSNLDIEHSEQLMMLFKKEVKLGKSFLWVTHDIHLATRFAEIIVTINNKKVMVSDNPETTTGILDLLQINTTNYQLKAIDTPDNDTHPTSTSERFRYYISYALNDLFQKSNFWIIKNKIPLYKFTTDFTVNLLSIVLVMLFLLSLTKMGFSFQIFMEEKLSDPRINNLRVQLSSSGSEDELSLKDKIAIEEAILSKGYQIREISTIFKVAVNFLKPGGKHRIQFPRGALTFSAKDKIINELISTEYDISDPGHFINSEQNYNGIILYKKTLKKIWQRLMNEPAPENFPTDLKLTVAINNLTREVPVIVTDSPLPDNRHAMVRNELYLESYHDRLERDPVIQYFLIYPEDIHFTMGIVKLLSKPLNNERQYEIDSALDVVQKIETIDDIEVLVKGVVRWSLVAVLVLSICFVGLTLYRNISRKKQEIGVFLAFGMKRRSFIFFYSIEAFLLWFSSSLISFSIYYLIINQKINDMIFSHSPLDENIPKELQVQVNPTTLDLPIDILLFHYGMSFIVLFSIFMYLIFMITSNLPINLIKNKI